MGFDGAGMRKRAGMISEDDPSWRRFWEVYPWRTAKLKARQAWATLNPDAALVETIIHALGWQRRLWIRQGFGTPYPATYLNQQRWTDEPPVQVQRQMSDAAVLVFQVGAEDRAPRT